MNKRPLNILVVDDDINFAHTLCEIFRTEGYRSTEVHSVEEAQHILKKEHFDCVLSDVRMQDKSGPELFYTIKENLPDLPFILMTAYTSNEIINEALESGVLSALQKPINIKEILNFFARLNQDIQGAIVCENAKVSNIIKKVLPDEKFTFRIYKTIDQLIHSNERNYSIVLIDTQKYCEHYSYKVINLLNSLPQKTIVIICDYGTNLNTLPQKLDLIILPREDKTYIKIEQILRNKFLQHAKESIQ